MRTRLSEARPEGDTAVVLNTEGMQFLRNLSTIPDEGVPATASRSSELSTLYRMLDLMEEGVRDQVDGLLDQVDKLEKRIRTWRCWRKN